MPETISSFAHQLVSIAEDQYLKFKLYDESAVPLCSQIQKYWTELEFPVQNCSTVPWSAVFISWCVKSAGASSAEFKFAAAHSEFVYAAIQNANNNSGLFRAYPIANYKIKIGDIIQNNRGSHTYDYDFAQTHNEYLSHSSIVTEIGVDKSGNYALTIGGNEGNSIGQKLISLTHEGFVQQRLIYPFISVICTLK